MVMDKPKASCKKTVKRGIEVIYVNYIPVTIGGDVDITKGIKQLVLKAFERAEERIKKI